MPPAFLNEFTAKFLVVMLKGVKVVAAFAETAATPETTHCPVGVTTGMVGAVLFSTTKGNALMLNRLPLPLV